MIATCEHLGLRHRALALWLVAGALCITPDTGDAHTTDTGDLRVVVFFETTPASDVSVEVSNETRTTDADGTAVFKLPPGSYAVRVDIPGETGVVIAGDVEIVTGEEVEVIATFDAERRLTEFDVESAAPRAEQRREEKAFADKLADAPKGTIRGVVRADSGPVAGARVFVRGTPIEAVTGETGEFAIDLPAGTYDITVIHARFTTANRDGVVVAAKQTAEVELTVDKATPQLDDYVVTAPHIEGGVASLVAERRESNNVADVIGAEEMSRSGDGDAAGALRRVTGITVIGGRFVYVRGMGERYSSTLLNGQAIPSPEPERRVIPLDLFSTDVLESVLIQKTPSPDVPGEFGGGVVQLRTKTFPEKLTASLSVSTGMVTNTTFNDLPRYEGGSLDWLGFDDGGRELPGPIREGSPLREGNQFEEGFTPDELAEFGRMLPNNYNVAEEAVAPARGFSGTVGDRRSIRGRPAGYLLSIGYGDDYSFTGTEYRRFVASEAAEGGLELNNDFFIRELSRTVAASGIFTAGIEPADGHEVQSTTLLLRITENETTKVTGRSDDLGRDIDRSRLRFAEQQLLAQQLVGEHALTGLGATVDWRYAFARASRDEPDRREYFYVDESADPDDGNPDFQISGRPAGNQRIWNELTDQVHDLGLDVTRPIDVAGRPLELKGGGALMFRDREFSAIRLTLRAPRMLSAEERRLDPETIWAADNINAASGWILEDTTQPTDAYSADQRIQAGYLMGTYPVVPAVEVMAGVRLERSRQSVTTFAPFTVSDVPLEAVLDNTDVLPSATVKWQLDDEMVLRGGYGRTVTRPDFRELSESQYRDVVTATRFVGNPDLERGTIDNFDARYEYYFSTDESVSLGAFYKRFTSPIEQVDLGGVDRAVSWDNADGATNIGVETEGRKRFGFVSSKLEPVFAALNLALIRSQVRLGEEARAASTSLERALQGQSPFVINAQLGYDDAAGSGRTAVLLLNVFGERIRDVGRFGTPDIFEEPYYQLDFVYGQKLGRGFRFKLKATNLLDRDLTFRQGSEVVRRYRTGRSLSFGLSWSM